MVLQQLKDQIQYGDYNTLAKMLNAPSPEAAKKRFMRENPKAIEAMKLLIHTRDKMIKDFLNK